MTHNLQAEALGLRRLTVVYLPRLAIRAKGDIDLFFDLLDSKLQLVTGQLDERFEIQARKQLCTRASMAWKVWRSVSREAFFSA